MSGEFSLFLLHNHFITEKIYKKKSGDVNDEANFPIYFLLHKFSITSARVEPLAQ